MGHVYVDVLLRDLKAEKKTKFFVGIDSTFSIIPYKMADEIGVQKAPWREKVSLANGSVMEFKTAFTYLYVMGRETVAKILLSNVKESALGVETSEREKNL